MPTPTIPDGELFMNATLYTGNGAVRSITNGVAGQSFQPDFVWAKVRSTGYSHRLVDSVRGATKLLYSDLTDAELTDANSLTAFNSNGFSLGTGAGTNDTNQTFVAWQWKAGGTAVTNTAGSITSQVSANTTSGFSVVTYTGTGANATVGHGLGVAPRFIIVKNRTDAGTNWFSYHISTGQGYLLLNATDAFSASTTAWNNTTPTSTVFSLGVSSTNTSAKNYVAYCWAQIANYSAFGSYTGNGSTDGPFVYLGFRPRFLLIKRTDAARNWYIYDSSRSPYNATLLELSPNLANAEATSGGSLGFDLLSNGFKLRTNQSAYNESTATYIYAAFAENPFKYANAR